MTKNEKANAANVGLNTNLTTLTMENNTTRQNNFQLGVRK